MSERLWTVEDVANFLGVRRSAVYQLVYQRRIPALKISKKCLRFDPAAIRRWLESKSRDANPLPHTTATHARRRTGRPRKHTNIGQDAYINMLIETAKKEIANGNPI